jgi:hypothetical protein
MRASILLWSMASGAILGLFIDATLIGVVMLASAALPALSARLHYRWLTMTAAVLLALIPISLIVLGFFEGEMKAR